MKNAVTITALVAVILVSAIFSYLELFSPTPGAVGLVKTAAEGRTIAESGRDYFSQLHQAGRLPGVGTNDHCQAIIGGWLGSYPYSLTMRLTKFPSTSARSLFTVFWNCSQVKGESELSGALAIRYQRQ